MALASQHSGLIFGIDGGEGKLILAWRFPARVLLLGGHRSPSVHRDNEIDVWIAHCIAEHAVIFEDSGAEAGDAGANRLGKTIGIFLAAFGGIEIVPVLGAGRLFLNFGRLGDSASRQRERHDAFCHNTYYHRTHRPPPHAELAGNATLGTLQVQADDFRMNPQAM